MQPPVPSAPQIPDIPEFTPEKNIKTALASIWMYLAGQVGISAVLSVVVGLFTGAVLSGFGLGLSQDETEIVKNLILLITSVLSCALVCLYAVPRLKIHLRKELQESRYKKSDLFFGVCTCYALALPLGLLTSLLSLFLSQFGFLIPEVGRSDNAGIAGEIIYTLMVVIAAPLCEEIVFRGIILNSLKKYSPAFAVVFSALLFALAHMNLYQGISVMGMGLAMGFMYLKTGSLQASIFMHFINNFIAVLADYIPLTYSWILDVVLLLLMVCGWFYMYQNRDLINRIACGNSQKDLWALTSRQPAFWLLVGLFAVLSTVSIVTGI